MSTEEQRTTASTDESGATAGGRVRDAKELEHKSSSVRVVSCRRLLGLKPYFNVLWTTSEVLHVSRLSDGQDLWTVATRVGVRLNIRTRCGIAWYFDTNMRHFLVGDKSGYSVAS